jgi:hypothetical protein
MTVNVMSTIFRADDFFLGGAWNGAGAPYYGGAEPYCCGAYCALERYCPDSASYCGGEAYCGGGGGAYPDGCCGMPGGR